MPAATKPNQAIQFLVPLSARRKASDEEGGGDWIPMVPVGRWVSHHFWHVQGIYEITAAVVQEMETNFNRGIPPIRIAGNVQHDFGGPAVGWVEGVRATPDCLEVRVRWTSFGQQQIDQELFAYISPEWWDVGRPYVISQTGETIPWVFDGFGLTNSPFFSELPGLVAERRDDGILVCAPGAGADQGDEPMSMPARNSSDGRDSESAPNVATAAPAPPAPAPDVTAVTAENSRLAARNQQLEAEAAQRKRETDLAALDARFAAAKLPGNRTLAPAHAAKLAETAIELAEDTREAHVAATIAALEQGQVETGERGGTSPHVAGTDVNPALFAHADRLRIPAEHVYLAAIRGQGGSIRLDQARHAVSQMAPLSASVEMPSLAYQDTMTLIRAMFLTGWESTEPLVSKFSNEVTDSARDIAYDALGAPPRMREWLDEIEGAVLNTLGPYAVSVRDWEATLEIPRSNFIADKLGQYQVRMQQMGGYARRHPDTLLLTLVAASASNLCYDGQNLCDTDHSEGDSGTQSNLLTTGYDDDEIADMILALDLNVAAMQGYKDDRGEVLDIGWEDGTIYDILCRPAARSTFNSLANLEMISGSTNGWKGRLRVHSSARFTVADEFWFCHLGAPSKPFIAQYQTDGEPSALKELGPDSEHCKKTGRIWVSTQGHYAVVPGNWRYIIKNVKA